MKRLLILSMLVGLSLSSLAFANDDDDLERVLKNSEDMSEEAASRTVPDTKTSLMSQPSAFRVEKVVPGSMYDQIGLKEGDVIKTYNGQKLDGSGASTKLVEELNKTRKLELKIDRSGEEQTINYDLLPVKPSEKSKK